jgi:hypothetical protein
MLRLVNSTCDEDDKDSDVLRLPLPFLIAGSDFEGEGHN